MMWLSILLVGVALFLRFGVDAPVGVQVLAISLAMAVLIMGLVRDTPVMNRLLNRLGNRKFLWIILGCLIVFNAAVRIYEKVWDFSPTKIYSLREDSVKWLQKMTVPVTLHIFLRSDDKVLGYVRWLEDSSKALGDRLTIEIHNINRDVVLARRYGVSQIGAAVLVAGERWVKLQGFREQDVMQGLVRLTSRMEGKLCFVVGHGEPDIESEVGAGLSMAADTLRETGLGAIPIELHANSVQEIATQCLALLDIGATSDFFPHEIGVLNAVLGKVPIFIALSTDVPPQLRSFLTSQGLEVNNRMLEDPGNVERGLPPTDIILSTLGGGPMTDGIDGFVYFPQTQAIRIIDGARWGSVLVTTPSSRIRELGSGELSNLNVVVASEGNPGFPALTVVGGSRPFNNLNWRYGQNARLFTQIIRTMLKEERKGVPEAALIDEPPMRLSEMQARWVGYVAFYILPGLAALATILIWWRRQAT